MKAGVQKDNLNVEIQCPEGSSLVLSFLSLATEVCEYQSLMDDQEFAVIR